MEIRVYAVTDVVDLTMQIYTQAEFDDLIYGAREEHEIDPEYTDMDVLDQIFPDGYLFDERVFKISTTVEVDTYE